MTARSTVSLIFWWVVFLLLIFVCLWIFFLFVLFWFVFILPPPVAFAVVFYGRRELKIIFHWARVELT